MEKEGYYQKLVNNYDLRAWQFIPQYNAMIRTIAGLIIAQNPKKVFDIGQGTANLQIEVLKGLTNCQFTCLDPDEGMIAVARKKLSNIGLVNRVEFIHQDISSFNPNQKYDLVVSNSVLHNLPYEPKKAALEKTKKDLLKPNANFIWGDLIRYADPKIQEYWVNHRIELGRKRKQATDNDKEFEKFIIDSFGKERDEDHPLTIEETLDLGRKTGFNPELVWLHDTFAIFDLK